MSSAIAANLAKGFELKKSVERAKNYLTGAISTDFDIGHGSGALNHGFNLRGVKFND